MALDKAWSDANRAWPHDLGGRAGVRQTWAAHSRLVLHDESGGGGPLSPSTDQRRPEFMELADTISLNKERADAIRHSGDFREVQHAYRRCAKIHARRPKPVKDKSAELAARLSRNKKAKRRQNDPRGRGCASLTGMRASTAEPRSPYRARPAGSPRRVGSKGWEEQMWFAQVASSSYAVGAKAAAPRRPRLSGPVGPELFSGEGWQEEYSRRYRAVLLERLMAVEPSEGETLPARWREILEQDHLGASELEVREIRSRIVEEFAAALELQPWAHDGEPAEPGAEPPAE